MTTAKLGSGDVVMARSAVARQYLGALTTVLVIGAEGMLGREVCRAVAKNGFDLRRSSRRPVGDGIVFDAERDEPSVLFGGEIAVVVNCAAVLAADIAAGGGASAEQVNARFPHVLVEAARAAGARV